jgi:hypothetical protein
MPLYGAVKVLEAVPDRPPRVRITHFPALRGQHLERAVAVDLLAVGARQDRLAVDCRRD